MQYTLHPLSKDHLQKLGVVPYNCSEESFSPLIQDGCLRDSSDHNPEIDEDFFEVEKLLDRRLSKDTLCYEFKVRFKGYGPDDDMWLPSSFFNRTIQFESTSKFGHKRKHKLDPENNIEVKKKKRSMKRKEKESMPKEEIVDLVDALKTEL